MPYFVSPSRSNGTPSLAGVASTPSPRVVPGALPDRFCLTRLSPRQTAPHPSHRVETRKRPGLAGHSLRPRRVSLSGMTHIQVQSSLGQQLKNGARFVGGARCLRRSESARGGGAEAPPQGSSGAYLSKCATISAAIIIADTTMMTSRGVQSRWKRMGLPPFFFNLLLCQEAPGPRPRQKTAALYGMRWV